MQSCGILSKYVKSQRVKTSPAVIRNAIRVQIEKDCNQEQSLEQNYSADLNSYDTLRSNAKRSAESSGILACFEYYRA